MMFELQTEELTGLKVWRIMFQGSVYESHGQEEQSSVKMRKKPIQLEG